MNSLQNYILSKYIGWLLFGLSLSWSGLSLATGLPKPGVSRVHPSSSAVGSLSITISPSLATYTVGQSLTVTVTGGTTGTEYQAVLYDSDPATGTLLNTLLVTTDVPGQNTVIWQDGQTTASFVVRLGEGSQGSGRVLEVTNGNFTDFVDSTPFDISPRSPLSLTLSGNPTVGQSVTATFTGGVEGENYAILLYDNASYTTDISGTITPTNSAGGTNTITWQPGQTSASFYVRFEVGSEGSGRILEVTNLDFTHLADSSPLTIQTCTLAITSNPGLNLIQGQSTTLTASGSDSYTWSTGETTTNISTGQLAIGTTTFSVTGTVGACSATASAEVTVFEAVANGPVCDTYTNRNYDNGLGNNQVNAVIAMGNTIYAATPGGLGISTDGGNSYTNYYTGFNSSNLLSLFGLNGTLYVGTAGGGLSISTDGGSTFTNKTAADGVGNGYVLGVFAAAGPTSTTVYAAGAGLSISTDGGNTFTTKTTANGLGAYQINGVYVVGKTVYAATTNGLSISKDGGNSFVNHAELGFVDNVYAAGSSVYVATDDGLYLSADEGNSYSKKTTADGLGNNKVNAVRVLGNTVYAATASGLSISTDGGNSFSNYTNGMGNLFLLSTYVLGQKIYASSTNGVSFCDGTPVCTITITGNPGLNLIDGQNSTLTASGATSYTWSTGETTPSISVSVAGTYSVSGVTGVCSSTASVDINAVSSAAALAFDGNNDYVNIPHNNAFNITDDITLETWIKTSSGDEQYILTKGEDSFYLGVNTSGAGESGKINVYLSGVSSGWASSNATVADGNWHHVAVTRSGTNLSIYIDGVLDNTVDVGSGNLATGGSSVLIGARGGSPLFNGSLDEVRIWNRALAPCEIQGTMSCELNPASQAGLVAYYSFNQGIADASNTDVTSLTDASGNGNTGTLTNFGLTGSTSNWVAPGGVTTGVVCSAITVPTVTIASSAVSISPGQSLALTASGTDTYLWSTGETTAAISVSVTGPYSVTGTVGTCSSIASVSVAETMCPISVSASSGLNLIKGQTTTLTASGSDTFTWSTGETTATISVSPTAATTYSVTGITGACSATASVTVNVFDAVANGPACDTYTNVPIGLAEDIYGVGNTIYIASNAGLGISTDGGATFVVKPTDRTLYNVYAVGESTPGESTPGNTIYASTQRNGLRITTDGGNSWVTKTTDDGLGSNDLNGIYGAGNTVYVATRGGLSSTTDGGNTFTTKTTADGLGDNYVLSVYALGSTVYAGTNGGLSISTDGGNSFINKTTADGLGDNLVSRVYAAGSTVYAATYGGLGISTDGGNTFVNKTTANGLGSIHTINVYALGNTVYVATDNGLGISTDGGNTFTNYTTANGIGSNLIFGLFALGTKVYAGNLTGGLAVCNTTPGCELSLSINPGTNLIQGQTTTLSAYGATSYVWSTGETTNEISVTPFGTTTYSVTGITGTCSATASVTVNVTCGDLPINIESIGLNIVQGQSTTLTASGADNFSWSTGETTAAISVSPSTATTYSVTGTTGGCSATATVTVNVFDAVADGPACDNYTNSTNGLVSANVQALQVVGNNVYAGTDNGLGISTDGGLTFSTQTTTNGLSGNNIQSVAAIGNTIYAGTYQAGLTISTDGGATWTTKTYVDGLGGNNVYSLNVQSSTIYAGTDGGLSISTDGGNTWITKTTNDGLSGNYVISLFRQGNTIYAGTNGGLSISIDGGNTFVNKTSADGLPGSTIMQVYAHGNTIYVGSYDYGVGISTDGGNTWAIKNTDNGLYGNRVLGLYVAGNTVYAASTNGLSISTDGGNTFTTKTTDNGLGNNYTSSVTLLAGKVYVGTYSGVSICNSCVTRITATPGLNIVSGQTATLTASTADSYLWSTGANTQSISVNPTTTTAYSVTTTVGACSPTASVTVSVFDAVADGAACDTYTNSTNGLGSIALHAMQVVDVPNSAPTVYVGNDGGLSISTDGGNTFTNTLAGNTILNVAVQGTTIIAGTDGTGLRISTDGGANFTTKTTADGLGADYVFSLYVQGNTIYAATYNGLSISTDGGNTWVNHTNGLGAAQVNHVFVLGNTIYAATANGLSISTDGGNTWVTKTTSDGLADNFISDVYAVGSTLYAGTNGSGLSISTDGGTTWVTKTTNEGLAGNSVASVYVAGNTIYAGTDGGLSISTDGGTSWATYTTANGLGDNSVVGVASVGNKVYAATSGGLSYCQKCDFTVAIAPTSSLTICLGSGTTLTATPTGNAASIAYLWSTGETTAAINVTPATTTIYSVTATVSGCSVIQSVTVTISSLPISIAASNGLNLMRGQSTTLTASGADNYTWSTGETTASIVVSPTSTTSYTVTGSTSTCPAVGYPTVFVFDPVADGPACDTYSNRGSANGLPSVPISVYAVGSTVYAALGSYGIGISTDEGRTFTTKTLVGAGQYAVKVFAVGNTAYAINAYGHSFELLVSTNGGANWTSTYINSGSFKSGYAVAGATGNTVYIGTDEGLFISNDGGNTFSNKTTADGLGGNVVRDIYAQGNTVYAATIGGLSISYDGGNTFLNKTTTNGLGDNNVQSVYAVGSTIYAATIGGLSISTDGGNTFINKTTTDGLASNTVNDVYAQGHTLYAATDAGLSISLDGGTTWTTKTTANGLGDNQVSSVFVEGNRVYAATNGGLSICPISTTVCSLTVTIASVPSLTITEGQSATLTASGADNFSWSTGETSSAISASIAATYSVTGTTGTCSATASVALSVTATAPCTPPIATITTNSLPYLTCTNFTVSLLAGGGTSYTFSTGATQTGGPTSNTATVTTAGVYSVTVADATGCTSVTTINVTTNYTTPTLTLSASSTTFCAGTRVTLTVGGGDYYTFSAGASQNGPNTAFVTTGGTYTVTANNGLTGCKDTKTISLTSIDLPTVSIAADPGLAIPASGSATLTASGGDTYLWSTGASSTIITTNIGGTYSVTATTSACSAATSLTLTGADLSPTLVLPQANFASGATNNFLVSLFEVNHLPTSLGAVLITVTAPVGYTLSFDNALTSMAVTGASVADGPATVSNANWTVTNTIENRQLSLLIKAGQSIASGATMNLGFSITRTTANSGSTANITVNIADDVTKGYDADAGNNVYARIINGL